MRNLKSATDSDRINLKERFHQLAMAYQLILSWEVPGATKDQLFTKKNCVVEAAPVSSKEACDTNTIRDSLEGSGWRLESR